MKSLNMVVKKFKPTWGDEGVGARVKRTIGTYTLDNMDPFLMLDFFKVRLPAGFPDHPHRGFETVTYMIEGEFHHEDFKGNKGIIRPGDIQWMTAGKGIVHSEIPGSKTEYSIGFQLWINLPQAKKMMEPRYQDFPKKALPVHKEEGLNVVVIAGQYKNVEAIIKPESYSNFYDVHLSPGAVFEQPIPEGWEGLVHPYTDSILEVDGQVLQAEEVCLIMGGNTLKVRNISKESSNVAKFILLYGKPLNEPIAKRGPFVMNTKQEINQAMHDYHHGINGFENAANWESKIKDMMDS